jgi:glyoxylase-like metal-dependent hydrolase (beta-lactamase superfamily II)
MRMSDYKRGMNEIGHDVWAWLEPPGEWGFANSGVIAVGEEVLVVDTQNDMRLGKDLSDAVGALLPDATVTYVVNTHADGDHWNGNLFYPGAEIVASRASLAEMEDMWLDPSDLGSMAEGDSHFARFVRWRQRTFEYQGWRPVLPTRTYEERAEISLGDVTVELVQFGPAHTRGDTVVHVPATGTVFAGDLLFTDSTPIMWAGPLARCVDACERILAWAPDIVVPGHGPVVGQTGVRRVRDYLTHIAEHASRCHARGLDVAEAYRALELGEFAAWPHASRAYLNLVTAYRALDPSRAPIPPWEALEGVLADDDGSWCVPSASAAAAGAEPVVAP